MSMAECNATIARYSVVDVDAACRIRAISDRFAGALDVKRLREVVAWLRIYAEETA